MLNNSDMISKSRFIQVLSCASITTCVIPGYALLGNLILQIFATASCTFLCLVILDFVFRTKPQTISVSIITMVVFWSVVALIKQVLLHIRTGEFTLKWFHLFYYDRPTMIFVVMFVCILYFIVKLIINKNELSYVSDYSIFMRNTTICFVIFYVVILFYCFILIREVTFNKPVPNLTPFETILSTFATDKTDYELLFLFLGNIAIFLPLGIFVTAIIKSRFLLLIFPIVLSSGIEVSQYYLGNGHPDIDDVLLNISGFYIGVLFKLLIDNLLLKTSGGKFKSFFIFPKNLSDTD